ncbi:transcription factor GTE9-like [Rutidosis leptorrhynchoides]|uniref:transcription factor GTE9-like n=1 Tax=Rutidosis leptorrhynchoides TaxID=125765 RepID=UPI003A990EDE
MAPTLPVEFVGQRVCKESTQKNFTHMMGKSRKVSKGYSLGFVPDYRHAVDTMAESEGYGSSGRIDTEMAGSDDSCAPKRKTINLSSDSYQQFGVPIQVLSLSKLSRIERKELGSRLKRELEQVRTFQKSFEHVLSPAMSIPTSHSKNRGPTGRGGNRNSVSQTKKAGLAPTTGTGHAMLMKQCDTLLNRLMNHKYGWVFNTPVDVVALRIPDYYTVIKHPMDLGTVKTKLHSGKYVDPWGFASDVRLTFSNALTYNPRGNNVHVMAETLSNFFEVRWKPIEKRIPVATDQEIPIRQNVVEIETAVPMPPLKKKRTASFGNEIKQEPVKRIMSIAEKQKLSSDLEASIADLPESIINFLKENSSNGNDTMDDEIEIEIDALSDDTLYKLRKLLDDFMVDKQKNTSKADTCEIELLNESGFSNSSMQACKVNDGNEEDIDIGGNDLPISSFPPVEIEKDTAAKNSKCSSSSSSSSESGSSSESDSDSSSGSKSNAARLSAAVNKITDTLGSEANVEKVTAVPRDAEDSVNGVGHVEQKSHSIPVSGEVDGRQEGENAPSERQVSPDKLYRAALLRSRFADTILKAQEKTNGKVEKQDIERLRLEKEELEKRRKEEKARLQAEARAAEEAKRNAELAAAAEAKRKRELEREAAREAIQKMEKMVEINDNSQFLEDLEMLTVAPAEPLQNFTDESSVDGFNFTGKGNPLEQLGLYMKDDDEEEEDDPQGAPVTVNDPEEGEID